VTTLSAQALVGAWRLVDWIIEYPATGRVTQPFGSGAQGLLLYTADGHMSAVLQAKARPAFRTTDLRAVADAEKASAFGSYLHYAGRWRVEGDCVVHEVDFSMNPNLQGTRQVRSAALVGDVLELTAEESLGAGPARRHRLAWRRASQRMASDAARRPGTRAGRC
jgi:hypothetical protein